MERGCARSAAGVEIPSIRSQPVPSLVSPLPSSPAAGAGLYAARLPERLKPGAFDVAGNSHQVGGE